MRQKINACAGFSRSKLAAIRDIADKAMSGVVPRREDLASLPDEEIIDRAAHLYFAAAVGLGAARRGERPAAGDEGNRPR